MKKEVRIKSLKSGNFEIAYNDFDLVFKTKKSFENWFKTLKPSTNYRGHITGRIIKSTYSRTQTYFTICPNFNDICTIVYSKKEIEISNQICKETSEAETFEKDCIFSELVKNFATDLQNAMLKIRFFFPKEQIEIRLNVKGKISTNEELIANELCNRAVGLVGYYYAKQFGWTTVLRRIYANY